MIGRRHFFATATLGGAALASLSATRALSQTPKPAAEPAGLSMSDRLDEPGPEAHFLEGRVGLWDVTETAWPAPASTPITGRGLLAERVMIGSLLQEFLRPPTDKAHAAVKRTDLLCYNRLDGRWDYVSFDTRDPVGLMPAWSLGRGDPHLIEFSFAPFAVPGGGTASTGQFLRMRQVIITKDVDHDVKEQYFTLADGRATEWLGHRYEYARRS